MFSLLKSIAILLVACLAALVYVSAAPVERPVNGAVEASDIEKASFNSLNDIYKPHYDRYYAKFASNSLVARNHEHDDHNGDDDNDSCNGRDDDHDSCDNDDESCDNCDNEHDDCHDNGSCNRQGNDHNGCGDDGSCDDEHDGREESTGNEPHSSTSVTVIYPPSPPLAPFPPFPPPATFPPFPPSS